MLAGFSGEEIIQNLGGSLILKDEGKVGNARKVVLSRKRRGKAGKTKTLRQISGQPSRMSVSITVKGEKPGSRSHFAGDNLRGVNPERAKGLFEELNNLLKSTVWFKDQSFRAAILIFCGIFKFCNQGWKTNCKGAKKGPKGPFSFESGKKL